MWKNKLERWRKCTTTSHPNPTAVNILVNSLPIFLWSLWKQIWDCYTVSMFKTYLKLYTVAAKSLQLCLCDPIDGSPPGSPVPGILQARTLEWVAISFSNAWKWKVKVKSLSRVQLLETPWTAAYQVLPSMGFSRQEYWSGVPLPSPQLHFLVFLLSIVLSH